MCDFSYYPKNYFSTKSFHRALWMGLSLIQMFVYLGIFFIILWSEFILLGGPKLDKVLSHLGTRTPYRFRHNLNIQHHIYPGCSEQKIWALVRHGTRNPSSKEILLMKNMLPKLAQKIIHKNKQGRETYLSINELEQLRKWSTDLKEVEEKLLSIEGEEEMILLAERMQRRFPSTMPSQYKNETFIFRYTQTQRAKESARHFAIGLFDRKVANKVWYPSSATTEGVLRFYKHCKKWQKYVKRNESTFREVTSYRRSEEMQTALKIISERLGLDYIISLDDAMLMYKTCGYETSWYKKSTSIWCYPFTNIAENFEYLDDLKLYWQDGYGFELNYRQACMPIKDMFDHFSDSEGAKASFLFSHSGALAKTLSHLGLYKPTTHLMADNRDSERVWRTSEIDCFASNIAFILYRCTDGDRVLTLHQERPVILPPCEQALCSLDTLRNFYKASIDCDFEDMCKVE